jgi:GTP cyclohydrolase I
MVHYCLYSFPSDLLIGLSDLGSRNEERKALLESIARRMLQCLGEDPTREGLVATPERFASAMLYLTEGYSQDPSDVVRKRYLQGK